MWVTSHTRVCNDLFGCSLRDATLSRHINALKNALGHWRPARVVSSALHRVSAYHAGFGIVKFLGVVVVLICHKLSARTIYDPPAVG